ncbi:MAG: ABC transporter permease [Tepidisphaeraceae bacterium]|jgi:ABC-type dipeptide/oligopeptide/nickel transport system permease component
MTNYIIRRILLMFPTLLGMTLVTFLIMGLSPGGVGGTLLNAQGTMKAEAAKAQREYLERRFGLNKPLIVQYVRWLNEISPVGFETGSDQNGGTFRWLKTPDLGYSFSKGRPVASMVAEALPITLLLNVVTLPITILIALAAGIFAARRKGGVIDVASGTVLLALWSIPTIWAGVMLIGFLANRNYLYWFPTGGLHDTLADSMSFLPMHGPGGWYRGWLLDTCWHLALPVICLTYGGFAFLARLTRGAILDNLASDYARTARAKGLDERTTLFRHVFRNSLLPLITFSAGILPALLSGAVVVEYIFSIHGMGLLILDGVRARDRELVLDEALVVGFVGLVSYLLADILYAVADPRVSYE